jgi:hypothetical protein
MAGEASEAPSEQLFDPIEQPVFKQGVLYAMAYLPSASDVELERANSLAELYGDGRPGYALYTYLLGGPLGSEASSASAAYVELLRVIETYVLGVSSREPWDGQHGFLLQVDPLIDAESSQASLAERAWPGLSLQMKAVLARQLRLFGEFELADRLEQSPGPFLITSLRPALIPMSAQAPLLIVDLQYIGPEYLYSLVDAYDRQIPSKLRGQVESLAVIRERLRDMFPNRGLDSGAAPPPKEAWIWLIGEPRRAAAMALNPTSEV